MNAGEREELARARLKLQGVFPLSSRNEWLPDPVVAYVTPRGSRFLAGVGRDALVLEPVRNTGIVPTLAEAIHASFREGAVATIQRLIEALLHTPNVWQANGGALRTWCYPPPELVRQAGPCSECGGLGEIDREGTPLRCHRCLGAGNRPAFPDAWTGAVMGLVIDRLRLGPLLDAICAERLCLADLVVGEGGHGLAVRDLEGRRFALLLPRVNACDAGTAVFRATTPEWSKAHPALERVTPEEWYRSRDAGRSSETIWHVMTGHPVKETGVPLDPADFGRCWRLLERFPEWKARMPEVERAFPQWRPFLREWPRLCELYALEGPSGYLPRMYDAMKPLVAESRAIK